MPAGIENISGMGNISLIYNDENKHFLQLYIVNRCQVWYDIINTICFKEKKS